MTVGQGCNEMERLSDGTLASLSCFRAEKKALSCDTVTYLDNVVRNVNINKHMTTV